MTPPDSASESWCTAKKCVGNAWDLQFLFLFSIYFILCCSGLLISFMFVQYSFVIFFFFAFSHCLAYFSYAFYMFSFSFLLSLAFPFLEWVVRGLILGFSWVYILFFFFHVFMLFSFFSWVVHVFVHAFSCSWPKVFHVFPSCV